VKTEIWFDRVNLEVATGPFFWPNRDLSDANQNRRQTWGT